MQRQAPPPPPPNPKQDAEDLARYVGYAEDLADQIADILDRTLAYGEKNNFSKKQMYHNYAMRRHIYSGATEENLMYFVNDPRPATLMKNILDELGSFVIAIAKLEEKLK